MGGEGKNSLNFLISSFCSRIITPLSLPTLLSFTRQLLSSFSVRMQWIVSSLAGVSCQVVARGAKYGVHLLRVCVASWTKRLLLEDMSESNVVDHAV